MKIVIATGGSGGHIFPALRTAQVLKAQGHEVLFAGVFKNNRTPIENEGFPICPLSAVGLSLSSVGGLMNSCFSMTKAFKESAAALRKFRPNVVCGFGGYGGFPVVAMALWLKFPSMIHEQNVVPGRANRFLGGRVAKIAVGFQESVKFFPGPKTVVTGNPCHARFKSESKEALLELFGLTPQKICLLVVGGSQGSRKINSAVMEMVPLLREELDFQLIHICGRQAVAELVEKYTNIGINFRVFDFLEDIGAAYQASDLVVGRAGAGTIVDLACFSKPAVLIPYPLASGHQKENAQILVERGSAGMIEEKDLTTVSLKTEILRLLNQSQSSHLMKEKTQQVYYPDAAERIASEIVRLGDS